MLVCAAPQEHLKWLAERTQCALTDDFRAIEAVDSSGAIRGMVGYGGWMPNSVQMHIALDTAVAFRALLYPAFDYVFEQAARGVALGVIPACNTRSLALAKHAGFREVYRVREGWAAGSDVVLLEMRREECRWLARTKKEAA
jgi:RimJ/RimL family protein N-acetyltransferase